MYDEQADNEAVYQNWCKAWNRDPEDLDSMLLFEDHCERWRERLKKQFQVETGRGDR